MSAQAQVSIGGIFLFNHYGAEDLRIVKSVRFVLSRFREKWNNHGHLAASILKQMFSDDPEGDDCTTFCIDDCLMRMLELLVVLDCRSKSIAIKWFPTNSNRHQDKDVSVSFEDFVTMPMNDLLDLCSMPKEYDRVAESITEIRDVIT